MYAVIVYSAAALTSSMALAMIRFKGHLSPGKCLRSSASPISSHAWSTVSMSSFVCAADTQKRTREVTSGVAGYATTTTKIGVRRVRIIRWNTAIFPGLNKRRGTTGESA